MRYRIVVLCLALGLLARTPLSRADSATEMMLGAAHLRVGMTRTEVTKALESYELLEAGTDRLSVWSGNEPIGSVSFEGDRLHQVEKSWGSENSDGAVRLFEAIFDALETRVPELPKSHRASLAIRTYKQPGLTTKAITIYDEVLNRFFDVKYSVNSEPGRKSVYVSVEESMFEPSPSRPVPPPKKGRK